MKVMFIRTFPIKTYFSGNISVTMSRILKKNHYIASPRVDNARTSHLTSNYEFSDGEESQKANTEFASAVSLSLTFHCTISLLLYEYR